MNSLHSVVPGALAELFRQGPMSQGKLEVAWRFAVGDALTGEVGTLASVLLTVGGVYRDSQAFGSHVIVDRSLYREALPAVQQVDGQVFAERAFALFLGRLSGAVDRLVVVGREAPEPDSARYAVGARVELVSLPYYRRLSDPWAVLRSTLLSLARFWRALRDVDCVWLLGPHPVAIGRMNVHRQIFERHLVAARHAP